MRFNVIVAPEAIQDLRRLPAHTRAEVTDGIERHLRHEPTKVSKSRIKRLKGVRKPQYRLRIGEVRVFYDVLGSEVHVLAIVRKSDASAWLEQWEKE